MLQAILHGRCITKNTRCPEAHTRASDKHDTHARMHAPRVVRREHNAEQSTKTTLINSTQAHTQGKAVEEKPQTSFLPKKKHLQKHTPARTPPPPTHTHMPIPGAVVERFQDSPATSSASISTPDAVVSPPTTRHATLPRSTGPWDWPPRNSTDEVFHCARLLALLLSSYTPGDRFIDGNRCSTAPIVQNLDAATSLLEKAPQQWLWRIFCLSQCKGMSTGMKGKWIYVFWKPFSPLLFVGQTVARTVEKMRVERWRQHTQMTRRWAYALNCRAGKFYSHS